MFRYTTGTMIREVGLWILALLTLFPFYLLVVTALKSDQEALSSSAVALPTSIEFSAFIAVLTSPANNIALALVNSVIITAGAIFGLVVLGSIAAYVLARRTAGWSRLTFYLVLIAILLPTQLGTLPLYMGARALGLTGSVGGVIILWVGLLLPFAVFLYAAFFRILGTEYEEAAAIDGASPARIFFRIVLPLMAPATGTVAILTGIVVWNDFFNALIFLSGSDAQTIPVSMYYYLSVTITEWNKVFAIVICSMIPVLVFYLFAQKQFMQGYAGGVKG